MGEKSRFLCLEVCLDGALTLLAEIKSRVKHTKHICSIQLKAENLDERSTYN